jgi:biliverdin reductase
MRGGKLGIAVVGLGIAGRARVRALESHPRARLVGVARRTPGPDETTLAEVLADPDVEALIVCTPNLLHVETARAALEAGRHVAVEFPLAPTAREARGLWALARQQARVLHAEHIELLAPSQQAQRERARALGRPTGGELRFAGGSEGWVGDERLAGSPALRAFARLHRLVDLFGEAEVEDAASAELSGGGYRLEVALRFREGGRTLLVEERTPGRARGLEWEIVCESGRLDAPPPASARGVFREDLDVFVARVHDGAPGYVSEERILHVLSLVEHVEALCAA